MVVAITGAVVGIGGLILNRRGMKDQDRQQAAANQALENKSRLDETKINLDAAMKRAEDAETRETRKQARIDVMEEQIDGLQQEVDEAHLYRRQQLSAQAAEFREKEARWIDDIATLRSVVVDEIARSAADTVLDRTTAPRHVLPAAEEEP